MGPDPRYLQRSDGKETNMKWIFDNETLIFKR